MGLLAASDDIAQVRGGSASVQIKTDIRQGSGQRCGRRRCGWPSDGSALARSMITSNASGGSGSLNTAPASRNVNSGGLAGRATTVVVDDTAARAAAGAAKRATATAAASRHVRQKTFAWCWPAIRALWMQSTTAPCAKTPRCKAR